MKCFVCKCLTRLLAWYLRAWPLEQCQCTRQCFVLKSKCPRHALGSPTSIYEMMLPWICILGSIHCPLSMESCVCSWIWVPKYDGYAFRCASESSIPPPHLLRVILHMEKSPHWPISKFIPPLHLLSNMRRQELITLDLNYNMQKITETTRRSRLIAPRLQTALIHSRVFHLLLLLGFQFQCSLMFWRGWHLLARMNDISQTEMTRPAGRW